VSPVGPRALGPAQPVGQFCNFDGIPGEDGARILDDVNPGDVIAVSCVGFSPDTEVTGVEGSALWHTSNSPDDIDFTDSQTYVTDDNGDFSGTFTLPDPFVAADPAAVCPPSAGQDSWCWVGMIQAGGGGDYISVQYALPYPVLYTGMASTPDGDGYWLALSDGSVYPYGDASPDIGSLGPNVVLNAPISHIVATPDGKGYWLVAADGGTFAFGDAGYYGSMGGQPLNAPVVDMAPTPDGRGYWLVAADGGIFAFGDATFHGSMGGRPLNQPIVGIDADPATGGYWLVAADGGIFAFDAPFYGSAGSLVLNQPVNGMAATPDGGGYWFVAADGGIFAYGDAAFHGSAGDLTLNAPVVGMAADPSTGGYWLLGADGGIFSYGAPYYGAGPPPSA